MTVTAAVGVGQAVDGREAGLQAAHQALNALGTATPAMAFLFASNHYVPRDVLNGAISLLGDTPMIGFSTPACLTTTGHHPHSVTLAVLAGDLEADAQLFTGYSQSGRETAQRVSQLAAAPAENRAVVFFADGLSGDAEQFCGALEMATTPVFGALSSTDLQTGSTYQLAGNQAGSGSLAAAFLRGKIRVGFGHGHGWNPVGSQFRITRSRGFWLRTLNGRPASETYADLFGHPARDWAFPPLNYLARLYPLGIEQGDHLLVRAPIRVEADGSFRMNAPVRDGVDAYLLVGSRAACEQAAANAAQQALLSIGNVKPFFALVLVDIAWQMLLEASPGAEIASIRDILGPDVPIAGGYTLGQVVPSGGTDGASGSNPQFLNQHIAVIAFADSSE
ncbi:MAG TPA: FIST N-terminal domain-containing protein [Anaerolineales bacterium]